MLQIPAFQRPGGTDAGVTLCFGPMVVSAPPHALRRHRLTV